MNEPQESIIVKMVSKALAPFIQVFGLYVVMHGHVSPGGGFQGGVLFSTSYILLGMAFGLKWMRRRFPLRAVMKTLCLGGVIFAGTGLLCLFLGANFLDYGVLPISQPRYMGTFVIEVGIGITVTAAMVSMYYDLAGAD